MIIDIDNADSVFVALEKVSKDWFDPVEMYARLKADGKANSSGFWNIPTQMLTDVSGFLGWSSAMFMNEWDERCIRNDVRIMGYHCTCYSDKAEFIKKGVLPLSRETISLSEDRDQTTAGRRMWEYRSQRSPGPWFLLSYKCAKKPQNLFCLKGPEILLGCGGHHIGIDPTKAVPLIIHCTVPYTLLSGKDYFAFCVLRAHFSFLDPEDDSEDFFDGYSIDLQGKVLDPRYIIRIEDYEISI